MSFSLPMIDASQARLAFEKQALPMMQRVWANGPQRFRVTIQTEDDVRSLKQNAYYFGFLLKEVARQARLNGIGAAAPGWHWFFKSQLLKPTFRRVRVPGQVDPVTTREEPSTRNLSVKKFAEYLQAVEAMAVRDFGVQLPADVSWQTYAPEDVSHD